MPAEESEDKGEIKKFGMFPGVFVPTVLTILGVIMFLRLGWVVGNVGVLGAWIIIGLSFFISLATALSMSSIVTNMKIGSGGAYSIISRSLGLEVGGSVGVPLYLSLSLSMAMYIFGFREGVRLLFPQLSPLIIDFAIFGILTGLIFLSTELAFKIQYLILAIVIGSVVSVFLGGFGSIPPLEVTAPEDAGSFWIVFAVFFPAATGIMAGANMSGELENPKKAIPIGTISAILVCLVIYLVLAYFLAGVATSNELVQNFTILIDTALFPPIVLAGLLAATLSSALNSMVGASRILQAMGEHNILPKSGWFSKRTKTGEPKNAVLFTALIVIGALLLRELNIIAPLITMFFLITYTIINLIILIEQNLELVSFRPVLKIPQVVPLLGTIGCLFAMFIINPIFSIAAIITVVMFYYVLMNKHLRDSTPYGDVRSSLFVALAEWAAKKSEGLPHDYERAWRPHLLTPFTDPAEIRGVMELIRDISFPRGSVNLIGIDLKKDRTRGEKFTRRLKDITNGLKDEGIHADFTAIKGHDFVHDATITIQSLKRALFSPNILFLRIDQDDEENLKTIIDKGTENKMGVILFADHPVAGLGRRHTINLWIPDECLDWEPNMKLPNCDLAILTAYKLLLNWNADLNVIATVEDPDRLSKVKDNLDKLLEAARIPSKSVRVVNKRFEDYIQDAPTADLNVFNLPHDADLKEMEERVKEVETSCIYCRDSTEESVLA